MMGIIHLYIDFRINCIYNDYIRCAVGNKIFVPSNADQNNVQRQNDAVSPSRYNKLCEEIRQNEEALNQLVSTKNNLNEELIPADMPGHQDSIAISQTITRFFGELGLKVEFTLGKPVTTQTKKVYTVASAFTSDMNTIYTVVDAVARVKSFNLTYLSFDLNAEDDTISGSLTMTITYLLNE